MKYFLPIFVLFLSAVCAKVSYDGNEVWRVHIDDEFKAQVIVEAVKSMDIDVWSQSAKHVDIRVEPQMVTELDRTLNGADIERDVIIKSLQDLIEREESTLEKSERAFSINQYNTLADIENYLLEVSNNKSFAERVVIGQTIEGRDIIQMRFSAGQKASKIWLDCGIHSREYVAISTCLYIVEQFNTDDASAMALLNNYDVEIIPVVNSDGYEYTWTDDRLWRKNRRNNTDSACFGVDLNRNFDANFGGVGSSDAPCANDFHGPIAFSEPETRAYRNAAETGGNYAFLASIHAYSQYWMYPYGWTPTQPADYEALSNNSQIAVDAIRNVHGTNFTHGSVSIIIYPSSGGTIDWTYDSLGITYSYGLELRDTGEFGFLLPENQIIPTAEETWAGIQASIGALP